MNKSDKKCFWLDEVENGFCLRKYEPGRGPGNETGEQYVFETVKSMCDFLSQYYTESITVKEIKND